MRERKKESVREIKKESVRERKKESVRERKRERDYMDWMYVYYTVKQSKPLYFPSRLPPLSTHILSPRSYPSSYCIVPLKLRPMPPPGDPLPNYAILICFTRVLCATLLYSSLLFYTLLYSTLLY